MATLDCFSATPIQVLKRPGTNWFEKVHGLAFSPDGKILAVGSSAPALSVSRFPGDVPLPEGSIEIWELDSGKLLKVLRQSARTQNGDSANQVGALTFCPDGKCLLGSDGPGYTLWELGSGKEKFRWRKGISSEPLSAAWSPDGRWLVLPSILKPGAAPFDVEPNGIAVVEAGTGTPKLFYPVEIGYARTARISPDGKVLATVGYDCTLRVFDMNALTNVFNDFVQTTMFAAGFSPDSRYLVAGPSWGGALLIYEISSGGGKIVVHKKGTSASGVGEVHTIDFTPDGKQALGNSSSGIELWNTASWASFKMLGEGYACLSPDGYRVALARESSPNLIEIWKLDELKNTLKPQK